MAWDETLSVTTLTTIDVDDLLQHKANNDWIYPLADRSILFQFSLSQQQHPPYQDAIWNGSGPVYSDDIRHVIAIKVKCFYGESLREYNQSESNPAPYTYPLQVFAKDINLGVASGGDVEGGEPIPGFIDSLGIYIGFKYSAVISGDSYWPGERWMHAFYNPAGGDPEWSPLLFPFINPNEPGQAKYRYLSVIGSWNGNQWAGQWVSEFNYVGGIWIMGVGHNQPWNDSWADASRAVRYVVESEA